MLLPVLRIVRIKVLFDKMTEYEICIVLPMTGIIYPGIVKGSQIVHGVRSKSGDTVEHFRKLILNDSEHPRNIPYEASN